MDCAHYLYYRYLHFAVNSWFVSHSIPSKIALSTIEVILVLSPLLLFTFFTLVILFGTFPILFSFMPPVFLFHKSISLQSVQSTVEKPLRWGEFVHRCSHYGGCRSPFPVPHPSLLPIHFALSRNRLVGSSYKSKYGSVFLSSIIDRHCVRRFFTWQP